MMQFDLETHMPNFGGRYSQKELFGVINNKEIASRAT